MRWSDARSAHPDRWLVVEALDAHSEADHRVFDRIEVVEVCADGPAAMKRYGELRRQHPHREFCFVHTSLGELKFEERLWLGIRGVTAAATPRSRTSSLAAQAPLLADRDHCGGGIVTIPLAPNVTGIQPSSHDR